MRTSIANYMYTVQQNNNDRLSKWLHIDCFVSWLFFFSSIGNCGCNNCPTSYMCCVYRWTWTRTWSKPIMYLLVALQLISERSAEGSSPVAALTYLIYRRVESCSVSLLHSPSRPDVSVLQGPGYRHRSGVSGRSLAGLCHPPRPAVQGWVRSLPPPPGESPSLTSKCCTRWETDVSNHFQMQSKLLYICCNILWHMMGWYWLIQQGLLLTQEDMSGAAAMIDCLSEVKFAHGDVSLSGL